jgi:hypothetical protein
VQGDRPAAGPLNFANDRLRARFVANVIDADRPAAAARQQGCGAANSARSARDKDRFPGHEEAFEEK